MLFTSSLSPTFTGINLFCSYLSNIPNNLGGVITTSLDGEDIYEVEDEHQLVVELGSAHPVRLQPVHSHCPNFQRKDHNFVVPI